jgi:hypothetical protein
LRTRERERGRRGVEEEVGNNERKRSEDADES